MPDQKFSAATLLTAADSEGTDRVAVSHDVDGTPVDRAMVLDEVAKLLGRPSEQTYRIELGNDQNITDTYENPGLAATPSIEVGDFTLNTTDHAVAVTHPGRYLVQARVAGGVNTADSSSNSRVALFARIARKRGDTTTASDPSSGYVRNRTGFLYTWIEATETMDLEAGDEISVQVAANRENSSSNVHITGDESHLMLALLGGIAGRDGTDGTDGRDGTAVPGVRVMERIKRLEDKTHEIDDAAERAWTAVTDVAAQGGAILVTAADSTTQRTRQQLVTLFSGNGAAEITGLTVGTGATIALRIPEAASITAYRFEDEFDVGYTDKGVDTGWRYFIYHLNAPVATSAELQVDTADYTWFGKVLAEQIIGEVGGGITPIQLFPAGDGQALASSQTDHETAFNDDSYVTAQLAALANGDPAPEDGQTYYAFYQNAGGSNNPIFVGWYVYRAAYEAYNGANNPARMYRLFELQFADDYADWNSKAGDITFFGTRPDAVAGSDFLYDGQRDDESDTTYPHASTPTFAGAGVNEELIIAGVDFGVTAQAGDWLLVKYSAAAVTGLDTPIFAVATAAGGTIYAEGTETISTGSGYYALRFSANADLQLLRLNVLARRSGSATGRITSLTIDRLTLFPGGSEAATHAAEIADQYVDAMEAAPRDIPALIQPSYQGDSTWQSVTGPITHSTLQALPDIDEVYSGHRLVVEIDAELPDALVGNTEIEIIRAAGGEVSQRRTVLNGRHFYLFDIEYTIVPDLELSPVNVEVAITGTGTARFRHLSAYHLDSSIDDETWALYKLALDTLEERAITLESRFPYKGQWQVRGFYRIGDMVKNGSHPTLYVRLTDMAAEPTEDQPGPRGDRTNWVPVSEWMGTWQRGMYLSPGNIVNRTIDGEFRLYMATAELANFQTDPEDSEYFKRIDREYIRWGEVLDKPSLQSAEYDGAQVLFLPHDQGSIQNYISIDLARGGDSPSSGTVTWAERMKLQGIEAGAEVNVQARWSQTDPTADDYIVDKPSLAPSNAEANRNARQTARLLETNTGDDRLDASAVKGIEPSQTTAQIIADFEAKTGTNRLDASAIDRLNWWAQQGRTPLESEWVAGRQYYAGEISGYFSHIYTANEDHLSTAENGPRGAASVWTSRLELRIETAQGPVLGSVTSPSSPDDLATLSLNGWMYWRRAWQSGYTYHKQNITSHGGKLWIANRETRDLAPSASAEPWDLFWEAPASTGSGVTVTNYQLPFGNQDLHGNDPSVYWQRTTIAPGTIPEDAEVTVHWGHQYSQTPNHTVFWAGDPTRTVSADYFRDIPVPGSDVTLDRYVARDGEPITHAPIGSMHSLPISRPVVGTNLQDITHVTDNVLFAIGDNGHLCFWTSDQRPNIQGVGLASHLLMQVKVY